MHEVATDCKAYPDFEIPNSELIKYIMNPENRQKLKDEIKPNTFLKCVKLVDVSIPSSVKLIGTGSFDNCSSLVEINLPSSLEKIEKQAFRGCWSLKKISIPSSVDCIKKKAFKGCTALESVEILSNFVFDKYNKNAFDGCTALNQVLVHRSLQVNVCNFPPKVKVIEFT